MREWQKPLPREMVLQIPHRVRSEIPQARDLRIAAEGNRRNTEAAVRTGGSRVSRRTCAVRSCAPMLEYPTEVQLANTVGFLKASLRSAFIGSSWGGSGISRATTFGHGGTCVSTVGLDEQTIRQYIRNQEEEERRQEQLPLGGLQPPSSPKKGL
jgi:hypothetical protein